MTDDTITAEQPGDGNRHLSRRTVLRAAGHAAWVVPAIQVVSLAPAFASGSDNVAFIAATGQWTRRNYPTLDYVTVNISIRNNSTTDVTTGLTLALIFPNLYVYGRTGAPGSQNADQTLSFSNVTTDWGLPVVTINGSTTTRTATVVFTPIVQIPTSTTALFSFRATTTSNVTRGIANGSTDTIYGITANANAADSTAFVPAGPITINPAR